MRGKCVKRKLVVAAVLMLTAIICYAAFTAIGTNSAVAQDPSKLYSGTFYIAGMGGHFAKADVTIDPANAANPIKINDLDRIVIGDKHTHAVHDPRIDANDRTKMYWSTYHLDPKGMVHVGISDLKTGEVIKDVPLKLDPRAKVASHLYCASGQTKKSYMPVTMTDEAYIDVFDKVTLKHKHRVFLKEYKPGQTLFYHGTNSPDMKKFIVAVNRVENGKPNGKIDFLMLDLKALESGKEKVLAKNTVSGEPGDTITFRQYFTNDGKYIMQSAGDRLLVLDAKTLKLVDQKMIPDGGQVHDAMPTPDGKYGIMTVRMLAAVPGSEGKEVTDGFLMLYDATNKKIVGKPASTCLACHNQFGMTASAVLCGIDGNFKKM